LIAKSGLATDMHPKINAVGTVLKPCSTNPMTGWFRDGCCNTDSSDRGLHVVCCILTDEFLEFARSSGNDLITPVPEHNFPGLKPGDKWCVCAQTWLDATENGVACQIDLEATHEEALSIISIDLIEEFGV
tara:strand:- start:37 stop:429 length:393 start_codon:yes stop_codon:yes gene_type:complete